MRGANLSTFLGDVYSISEYFRRMVIKFFPKKELINAHLGTSLIN